MFYLIIVKKNNWQSTQAPRHFGFSLLNLVSMWVRWDSFTLPPRSGLWFSANWVCISSWEPSLSVTDISSVDHHFCSYKDKNMFFFNIYHTLYSIASCYNWTIMPWRVQNIVPWPVTYNHMHNLLFDEHNIKFMPLMN